MGAIEEIKASPRLRNIFISMDGGSADIHIDGWDGSIIWSTGAGWEHVSVSPYRKNVIPSWESMCSIKDIFWNDDEAVIQIHPKKTENVNNMSNCLHLWRCTYKEMILPPSCLVGIRKGQTMAEMEQEVKEAYALAGEEWK